MMYLGWMNDWSSPSIERRQPVSRSKKRTPVIKQGKGADGKRAANRKVRQLKDLPTGKSKQYKRFYPQWDVWDFRFYLSERSIEIAGKKRLRK